LLSLGKILFEDGNGKSRWRIVLLDSPVSSIRIDFCWEMVQVAAAVAIAAFVGVIITTQTLLVTRCYPLFRL
jgi:hypothetical protein